MYNVGFAYFGNPMGSRTPNVTPADMMAIMTDQTTPNGPSLLNGQDMTMLSTNFNGQSETTIHYLVDSAVTLTMSGVALAAALLSF